MGEFADYALEDVEEYENLRHDYRCGRLPTHHAYEYGIIDELGREINGHITKTCRCCGKSGLAWGKLGNKFVLFDGNGVHECPINPLRHG